jgi:hypothetical protein
MKLSLAARNLKLPILLSLLGAFFVTPGAAQEGAIPDPAAPPQPPISEPVVHPQELIKPKPSAAPHRFWDRENLWLFSGIAVTRGMDYASTRNFQARGRQEILLPDQVVDNSAGFASLEAAGTMTSIGISYLFHRTGHHKLERWLSVGHISVTAFGDVRNYCLESKHR